MLILSIMILILFAMQASISFSEVLSSPNRSPNVLAYIDEKYYKDREARLMVEIAESAYEQVGKEMHLLETEITHYYKGKVPKRLRSMIQEAEKSYTDAKIAALKAVE